MFRNVQWEIIGPQVLDYINLDYINLTRTLVRNNCMIKIVIDTNIILAASFLIRGS